MSRHLQTLFLLAVLSFLFVIPTQAQVTTASMSVTCPKIALHSNNYKKCTSYD